MICFYKKIATIYLIILSFSGCISDNVLIYQNLSFEETLSIAHKQNTPFCIIVSDNRCSSCDVLKKKLKTEYRKLIHKAVFNAVNTNQIEQEWYKEWLYTPSGPIICVFSVNGDLINIIAGANLLSMQCVEKTIDGTNTRTALYYHSPLTDTLGTDKIIPLLGKVLKCKLGVDMNEDVTDLLKETTEMVTYPFNLYLESLNLMNKGDVYNSVRVAKQLSTYSKNQYARLYFSDLLLKASEIIKRDSLSKINRHDPSKVN